MEIVSSRSAVKRTLGKVESAIVAYDFSEASRKALRHTLAIARHYGAKLHLAYVVSSIGYGIAGPEASQLASEESQRDMRQLEADLLKSGELAGLQYEFVVREGHVWGQIQLIVEQKRLGAVVVGTRARGSLGTLLRLVQWREPIFHHADCLVLTVGPVLARTLWLKRRRGRSLFASHGLWTCIFQALPYAASFANHFGARLIVLHFLPAAPIPEGFHWSTTGYLMQIGRKNRRWLCHADGREESSYACPPAT